MAATIWHRIHLVRKLMTFWVVLILLLRDNLATVEPYYCLASSHVIGKIVLPQDLTPKWAVTK